MVVPTVRPLNSAERRLIAWLLETESNAAYREQLSRAHVVSTCGCGCPSIDLALGDSREKRSGGSTILAEANGRSTEGALVGVMLHEREGELSELEVYCKDGYAGRFSLPKPEDLTR